jgi:hypothetical protein
VGMWMWIHFVDGNTLFSDTSKVKVGLFGACKDFKNFGLTYASALFCNHSLGIT